MSERLRNNCCWSSSREVTFNECKKKYWYSYYGAWEGWPLNYRDARTEVNPLSAYLYRLKNMQPLVFFIGSSVHKTIEECIKEIMRTKALPPLNSLLEKGQSLVIKGLEDSRTQAWKKHPKKHVNLLEDYYNKDKVSTDDSTKKVSVCLTNWYNSQIVQSMLLHPHTTMGDVEKPMQFFLSKEMECIVVYDLYLHWKKGTKDEKLFIFDWKTGAENARIGKQLSAYALAAMTLLKAPFESIVLCPFYVSDSPSSYKKIGSNLPNALTEADIETTKQDIQKALTLMKELHSEPIFPEPTLFSYTEERRMCASCPFQEVCQKAEYQDKSRQELSDLCLMK